MDFIEKAKVRLEHWIDHNEHHYEDYELFAKDLEKAGKVVSAEAIRDMMALTAKSTECLKRALKSIE